MEDEEVITNDDVIVIPGSVEGEVCDDDDGAAAAGTAYHDDLFAHYEEILFRGTHPFLECGYYLKK